MGTQFDECTKSHWVVPFKLVNYIVHELSCNEIAKKSTTTLTKT